MSDDYPKLRLYIQGENLNKTPFLCPICKKRTYIDHIGYINCYEYPSNNEHSVTTKWKENNKSFI